MGKVIGTLGRLHRWYWLLALFAAIVCVIVGGFAEMTARGNWFALAALIGSGAFMFQKQLLDEATLLKDLFPVFNARYAAISASLEMIASMKTLESNDKLVLVQYFNLCAEEYLFFKRGAIPRDVWNSWFAGMRQYSSNQIIRQYWEQELATNSYYGFPLPK